MALTVLRGLMKRDFSRAAVGLRKMASEAESSKYQYESLKVALVPNHIIHVEINRPEKRNAMNKAFWSAADQRETRDLVQIRDSGLNCQKQDCPAQNGIVGREMVLCFQAISEDASCRAVVISGAGKMFTSGIDLFDLGSDFLQQQEDDPARIAWNIRKKISDYQETFSVIEKCTKPVIAAVHNACIGGGVDLISACDIRYCTQDAWFQVKEVDLGLAADVGTLQRLPKVIGNRSLVNELAFTARKMMSEEAKTCGLVSRVFPDKASLLSAAFELASEIASKSPVAVQGTKVNLVYARDHSVQESLDYMATWNMSMLQSQDLLKSAQAAMEKKTPKDVVFSKL